MSYQSFIRDFQSRFEFLLDVKTELQRGIRTMRRTPFEAEYEILRYLTANGRCALDVGANRGQSIDAIRLYHPKAQIFSFEPNKGLYDKLESKFAEDKNLDLLNLGLGAKAYSAPLYIPYYRDFMYDGLSSFTRERASKWLNEETVWRFNPSLLRVEEHPCTISLLDKFSYEPFFLKIHVQGFEYDVLQGAKKTLDTHNPVLLLANNEKADLFLRTEGWLQYVLIQGRWNKLKVNDMRYYNCVYFNPNIAEHREILKALNIH